MIKQRNDLAVMMNKAREEFDHDVDIKSQEIDNGFDISYGSDFGIRIELVNSIEDEFNLEYVVYDKFSSIQNKSLSQMKYAIIELVERFERIKIQERLYQLF